jgi:hypothetical protein
VDNLRFKAEEEEEEEELLVQRGPGVNEVSFCARPHHNMHSTLEVNTGTTGPRWRVDLWKGGGDRGGVPKPILNKCSNSQNL